MSISFKCPACGAPLEYAGGEETTVQCSYCTNTVAVPPELRPAPAPTGSRPVAPPDIVIVPLPPTPALPSAPGDARSALKQMRLARRLERRMARRQGRALRH